MSIPSTKVFLSSAESDPNSIRKRLSYIPSTHSFRDFLQRLYCVLIRPERWPEDSLPLLHRNFEQLFFSLDAAWLDYQELSEAAEEQSPTGGRISLSDYPIDQGEPHIMESTWPAERNERFKGEIQFLDAQEVQSPLIFYQKLFMRRSHGDWKRYLSRWQENALDDRTFFETHDVSPATIYDDYVDLVKLMEVNWLHRYEKGKVIPDAGKINMLSKALNISPDYFFRTTKVEFSDIQYKKLSRLPQKDVAIINETTKEYLSRYFELEEIIGLSHSFDNPLKDFGKVTTYEQVNKAAELLRKEWSLGTGPIFNIVELFEDKNIKVVKLNVDEDFDGLQTYVNKTIPVVAYNERKVNKADRIRFTLLHELAHLLLVFGDVTEKQKETLCHQFAGAMLLPEEIIKAELGNRRTKLSTLELGNIKKQYGISMQAIVMRAKVCGYYQ